MENKKGVSLGTVVGLIPESAGTGGVAGVSSVNAKSGKVTLTASDVGALPENTQFVSSVNGNSGAISGVVMESALTSGSIEAAKATHADNASDFVSGGTIDQTFESHSSALANIINGSYLTSDENITLTKSEQGVKIGASSQLLNTLNTTLSRDGVKQVVYDNTTFASHIDEILGFVNSENGGSLISLGFKVGDDNVTTTTTELVIDSVSNTSMVSQEEDEVILMANTFYYAYPEQVVTMGSNKGVFFSCRNAWTLGKGTLYIETANGNKKVRLSGQTSTIESGAISQEYFQDVDITSTQLEHIVITYHA